MININNAIPRNLQDEVEANRECIKRNEVINLVPAALNDPTLRYRVCDAIGGVLPVSFDMLPMQLEPPKYSLSERVILPLFALFSFILLLCFPSLCWYLAVYTD